MKIAVFGATGGIGKHVVTHALEKGYEVNAYVRNSSKMTNTHANLSIFEGQVSDYEKIKECLVGCGAVIIALGISMKPGFEDIAAIEAHRNIISAMTELNIKRLVDWSTPSINFSKDTRSSTTVIPGILAGLFLPKAKKVLKEVASIIVNSNLDWTIVRFMAPKDTPFTGNIKVSFGESKISFNISRSDIAYYMVQQIESKIYYCSMPIIGS